MSERMRDRLINAIITVSITVMGGIIVFSFTDSKVNQKELIDKVNDKLDRSEFKIYETEHKQDHLIIEDRITKHFDKRMDQMETLVKELNK